MRKGKTHGALRWNCFYFIGFNKFGTIKFWRTISFTIKIYVKGILNLKRCSLYNIYRLTILGIEILFKQINFYRKRNWDLKPGFETGANNYILACLLLIIVKHELKRRIFVPTSYFFLYVVFLFPNTRYAYRVWLFGKTFQNSVLPSLPQPGHAKTALILLAKSMLTESEA